MLPGARESRWTLQRRARNAAIRERADAIENARRDESPNHEETSNENEARRLAIISILNTLLNIFFWVVVH